MASEESSSPFAEDFARPPAVKPAADSGARWKIVIVDDEQEVHDVTALALRAVSFDNQGLSFLSAHSAGEARVLLENHPDAAVVLLDVVMETEDAGLRLVHYIRESLANHSVRVVLRTGQPGQAPETTVIRDYDISDYRTKTEMTSTRLYTTVIAALRTYQQLQEVQKLKDQLEKERDYLREEVATACDTEHIVGGSPAFASVIERLDAVAGTDATVMILGESGVGKEVLARAIHARSPRAQKPLVKVNCASIPRELFESEFFGHVKGAFTGAHRDRVGRMALADGGTLFLDEIGEIPVELQSKLLRALQEREFEAVGDTRTQKVDVRVVAATNRDLKAEVAAGRFRADLYYRLGVFPVHVPPLRERRADIVPLFEHFLAKACRGFRRPHMTLTEADIAALERYPWPGNVRELQNVVERAAILSTDGIVRLDLALDAAAETGLEVVSSPSIAVPPSDIPERGFYTAEEMHELERRNLYRALEATNWKIAGDTGAAAALGMKPSTVTYQMRQFGIRRPDD